MTAGHPMTMGTSAMPAMGMWMAKMYCIDFCRLPKMRLPKRMPRTMDAKLSSTSTRSADSRATSVPRAPMAMPTWAAFRAGASFTPSPVMATTSPFSWSACTMRNFWCGEMRAHTVTWASLARSSTSSRPSSSAPVSVPPSGSPACRAISQAVTG